VLHVEPSGDVSDSSASLIVSASPVLLDDAEMDVEFVRRRACGGGVVPLLLSPLSSPSSAGDS
jgi:hypothetical protein